MNSKLGAPFGGARGLVWSLVSSLRATLVALWAAIRERSLGKLVALLSEGSPLEEFIQSLLTAVFWILLFAPVIIVPLYYLGLSVIPK